MYIHTQVVVRNGSDPVRAKEAASSSAVPGARVQLLTFMCIHIYIYIYTHKYMYTHVCIYIYI